MLKLEKDKENKRKWVLREIEEDGSVTDIICLDLIPSSITNKFTVVKKLINEMHEIPAFSEWFSTVVKNYVESGFNSEYLLAQADSFMVFSERYVDSRNIDFTQFSKIEKSSKTSVMFLVEDIRAIVISSTALKLYSIFCYDGQMKLPENVHKQMYEKLVKPCIDLGTTTKIFKLIRSRMYRSSITDRYMWDMVRIAISETPDSYVMTVFNFLMINMVSTLSVERNPIPFLVSIIDDSIRWMMRTVYKDRVVYGEVFGGSDDIYGSSISKESFYVYCCNDVIGKAAKAGMDLLENEHGLNDEQFNQVRDRIDNVDCLTPPMRLLVLPIVSKVLEIPYKFLLTCPPKHGLMMGIFMHHLARGLMDDIYPVISEFLISCPIDMRFESTRSSYRIRNLEFIINDNTNIFGFSAKKLRFDIMSSICGVLSASKKDMVNTVTGCALKKITYFNLEKDVTGFYKNLYSNGLEHIFARMRNKADAFF